MTQQQPKHDGEPLPVDPGHVRQRQHYEAMLAQCREEQKQK
jgi:hypothetical protein